MLEVALLRGLAEASAEDSSSRGSQHQSELALARKVASDSLKPFPFPLDPQPFPRESALGNRCAAFTDSLSSEDGLTRTCLEQEGFTS